MRILIHGLNFAPELTGIGKYTGELALFLVEKGHRVRVVTTPPYYPQWKVEPGYPSFAYRKKSWQGIEVYRCPLWVPRRPTGFARVLHLASFAVFSLPAMLFQIGWKPHLVFSIAPAIAGAPFSWMAARLSRSKTWLHIQDFELDAAARLGILPGIGAAKRALESLETALYNGFDRVSTISRRMLEHLWRKGVPAEKTVLFPNWVDEKRIYPAAGSEHLRLEWNIEPERTLVLYSGNMGRKQGLETLIECARLLCQETGIFFILCGEGAVRPLLEKQAQGLSNLRFSPLLPVERLNELLNSADIHVLLQRADAADLVMPSKLGGMLASGRPVIATALPGTELAQVIDQVGRLVPPEDPRALADAILQLASQPDKQSELGRKGRFFVEQNWSKSQVLSKFLLETHQLLGS